MQMDNRPYICRLSKFLQLKKSYLLVVFLLGLLLESCSTSHSIKVKGDEPLIGIIADCQYADQPTGGIRHYRLSPEKLKTCVKTFNTLNLSHVFHLGDFIDKGGMETIETVLPIINNLSAPHTLVLGNHDFSVPDSIKEAIPKIFGLEKRYFSIKMDDWKFIILDGNDVSLYAWPPINAKHQQATRIYEANYSGKPTYNGALGEDQMNWLQQELKGAEKAAEKVFLLCHFPILPIDNHVLWNAKEVLELISSYSCVKAWLNGHNHAGDYAEYQGIHFITFKGMVDTETNAFATIQLLKDRLLIKGNGRELDRELILR